MFQKGRKKNTMGIHFAKENRITSSKSLKVTYTLRLFQLCLMLFGIYGPIYGFISGLGIEVNHSTVYIAILLSTIYYFIIFQFPNVLKYSLIGTMIVGVIVVYEFLDEIKNGFWHIENYVIYHLNNYYNLRIYPYVVGEYDKATVLSIFITLVIVVLGLFVSSAILYNTLSCVYILISLILIIFPLTVGLIPGQIPLALYLVFIICIVGMSKFNSRYIGNSIRRSHKKQWKLNVVLENRFRYIIGLKVGIILSVILTLLFLSIPLFFSKETYEELNLVDTKVKLQDKLMNFSMENTANNIDTSDLMQWSPFSFRKSYGGLSGGELGKDGDVTFDNKAVLKVEMPITSSPLYLKGYVGTVYTGDRWDSLSAEDETRYNDLRENFRSNFTVGNQSSYFLSLIEKLDTNVYKELKFNINSMKVTNVRSNKKYSYAPYNTLFDGNTMNILDPLYVFPDSAKNVWNFLYYTNYTDIYKFSEVDEFFNCLAYYNAYTRDEQTDNQDASNVLNELIQYRDDEHNYRTFVYSTYTKLSDKVSSRLVGDFGGERYSHNGMKVEGEDLEYYLTKVSDYLEQNTSYSLKPGPLPKGKDFIEHFLYENKIGYCAHYASAATVMLRIMGVPARYVEGYIVKDSNISAGKEVGRLNAIIRGEENEVSVPIKEVNVLDANAHAWVEIYIDGFGWVPYEFTSGYMGTSSGILDSESSTQLQPTSIPSPTNPQDNNKPTVTLAPTTVPDTDDATGYDSNGMNPEENGNNSINGDASNNGEDIGNSDSVNRNPSYIYFVKLVMIIVRVIFILLLIVSIIAIRWFYLNSINRRKLNGNNMNKVVILRYKELIRMLAYYGVELNNELPYHLAVKEVADRFHLLNKEKLEEFIAISLKAKFSRDKISEEDSEKIELYYKECIDAMYNNRSFLVKLYMKYIKIFV